jgi:PHD/YefM family antitoxin component YafN of YafNO toxin-antitoxin module
MNKVPQMASVADIKHRHLDVFAMLKNGPVLVANRSKPAAVIVSPELWDSMIERLEDAEDLAATYRHKWLEAMGQVKAEIMTPAQVDEWLAEDASEKILA